MIEGHNPDDPGVRLLGAALQNAAPHEVLLVHCGDLPGIAPGASRLVLDVRECVGSVHRCIPALVDPTLHDFQGITQAAVWPRAHLGKDFTMLCLALAASVLRPGGNLWCAIRKRKGADGVAQMLEGLLGNLEVVERDRGYRLLRAMRRKTIDEKLVAASLGRRYRFGDPLLGTMELEAVPGVFSRRGLDAGTRVLLQTLEVTDVGEPARIVDLGAGVGPLTAWAAARWNLAHVMAVESNYLAADMLRRNVERLGFAARVRVLTNDGLPYVAGDESKMARSVDLVLANPPTHASPQDLLALFASLRPWMAANGRVFAVVSRPGRTRQALVEAGAIVESETRTEGYWVLGARWADPSGSAALS